MSLMTPAADDFVCRVMRDSCPDVWAANDLTSLGECEAKLAALPFADGDLAYADGNTCASPSHTAYLTQPLSLSLFLGHTASAPLIFRARCRPTKVC